MIKRSKKSVAPYLMVNVEERTELKSGLQIRQFRL